MSMATRCTSCGTIFRVVQDQLKVSEGWVRCGRCDEVFNALEGLFDLERDKPPPWIPRSAEQASAQAEQRREAFSDAGEQTVAELDEDDRIASRFFRPEQDDVDHSPAESVASRDRADFADAPRRIDDVSVDSTSLSRAAPGSDDFRLTVTLRNRGALPVSSPWIELSLTDPNGQLIARRALAPRDFRAPLSVIQAGGDAALQLLFS